MLAAVVVLAVAGSFRVLCVGADGHVGIEPVRSDCCGTDAPDAPGDDDCGDCVDLVVEGDLSRVDRAPTTELPGPDVVAEATAGRISGTPAHLLGPVTSPEPGVPRGSLDALRTVVRRC